MIHITKLVAGRLRKISALLVCAIAFVMAAFSPTLQAKSGVGFQAQATSPNAALTVDDARKIAEQAYIFA